jgi:hypothetical protein
LKPDSVFEPHPKVVIEFEKNVPKLELQGFEMRIRFKLALEDPLQLFFKITARIKDSLKMAYLQTMGSISWCKWATMIYTFRSLLKRSKPKP